MPQTASRYAIGLKILNQLVSEMNQVSLFIRLSSFMTFQNDVDEIQKGKLVKETPCEVSTAGVVNSYKYVVTE